MSTDEPYVPLASLDDDTYQARVVTIDDTTRSAVWIALIPLLTLFPAMVMFILGYASPLASAISALVVPAALVATAVLAFVDSHELRRRGIREAASGLWIFLSPFAYLVMRWRVVRMYTGGGWGPLVALSAISFVVGSFAVIWFGTIKGIEAMVSP